MFSSYEFLNNCRVIIFADIEFIRPSTNFKDNYAIKRPIMKLLAISIQFDKTSLSPKIAAYYSKSDEHFHRWRMKNIFALKYFGLIHMRDCINFC